LGDRLAGFGLFGFPLPRYGESEVAGSAATNDEKTDATLRYFFKDGNVLITRSQRPGAPQLGLAIKGGDNGFAHSHNDNGSYVVVCNGNALLIDPGSESYTAKSFGSHRFESMFMNSYGHPVPYIAGTLQRAGKKSRGAILHTAFTEEKDTLVMDLLSGYPVAGLRKLQRTFVLDRVRPAIEIIDEAEFDQPADFGSALVTNSSWKQQAPGVFLIRNGKTALLASVTVQGAQIEDRVEQITGFLPPSRKRNPTRIGLNLSQPAHHVLMHTVIVPTEPPGEATKKAVAQP